jgi:CRP-like cAMP-binding protein
MVLGAGDRASVGFLYIVMSGVLRQQSESDEVFLAVDDVFGELGVLVGSPLPDTVTVFSSSAVLLQIDCRAGSRVSTFVLSCLLLKGMH